MIHRTTRLGLFAALLALGPAALQAGVVATYEFNGTLNADQAGVAALTATNPLGQNTFLTDSVDGNSRTVYGFRGATIPSLQAGLTFDSTGLISSPDTYSVEMVFDFFGGSGWRRIMDVANRGSDSGFYVDPSNNLDIFPVAGSGALFTASAYHYVVLTDNAGSVTAYLDGVAQFTASTTVMNISGTNLINFFLDNTVGGGQGEYSKGNVALIRVSDSVLSAADIAALAENPFPAASAVPEPTSMLLMGSSLLAVLFTRRKRS